MSLRTLMIALLAVAALAGCGRRGDLEAPGGRPAVGAVSAPPTNVSPLDPGSTVVPAAPAEAQPATKRHFLLDFLL